VLVVVKQDLTVGARRVKFEDLRRLLLLVLMARVTPGGVGQLVGTALLFR
jgi:hypothetical protein